MVQGGRGWLQPQLLVSPVTAERNKFTLIRWHVLKPETKRAKRNHRNETTETTETSKIVSR